MKNKFIILVQLLLVLSFCQESIQASAFSAAKNIGKVMVKSSPVIVVRKGKRLKVGRFGMNLQKGDIVITPKGGKAQIVLSSGDSLFLASSSQVVLNEEITSSAQAKITRIMLSSGKIRAHIKKKKKRRIRFRTANAIIGVKGTDFVVEHINRTTTVGTREGLVNMASAKSGKNIDIPPGKMSSISPSGEVMPLSEFAGELMKGVEFAGERMRTNDMAGEKMKF